LLQLVGGSCEQAAERLSDYSEGELGLLRRARLRLHLSMCAGCRAALASLRTTVEAIRSLGRAEYEPAPELARAVVEQIRRAHR